jgi:hypothetical protein
MALVTLIDPVVIKKWNQEFEGHPKYSNYFLNKLKMNESEGDGIFFGLCIVVGMQIMTAFLIANEFVFGLKDFPVKTYWILIPRFISSFYMHSTLTAEISNGLDTMKYVCNHPHYFKRRALEDDDDEKTSEEDGWYIRVFYAFMLGFVQYFLSVVLEIMTIIFLNSLGSYLFILICYAALAGVTTFDNMYASALSSDNPINAAVGKKLMITYNRYMGFAQIDDHIKANRDKREDQKQQWREPACQSTKMMLNQRKGNCLFQTIRFIYKAFRIFHVSFFFYFAPFLMLFYQFYINQQTQDQQ